MRVLLTNHTLAERAGTELYIRDVAIELMRRGHRPVCYSTRLGAVAEEIRAATVPVVDDLDCVGAAPDIIHGHHHYETLTAMLRFPQTPAISFCHGWFPKEEAPLRFPRIYRYGAVSEVCRERLIAEGGIAQEQVELVLNFFDARLFAPREPLPEVPRRALAFGNLFREDSGLGVLREACRRCGIEMDAAGKGSRGSPESKPGALLGQYDIVFAVGRAAIEALAVGNAVVLAGTTRLGPMVSASEFDSLRAKNFALRTLAEPLTVDGVVEQLRRYDARDAAAVSERVRRECELQPAVDRMVALYEAVIEESGAHPPETNCQSEQAVARYLRDLGVERWETLQDHLAEIEGWRKRAMAAEQAVADMRGSASWRLTQGVLRNPAVRLLLRPFLGDGSGNGAGGGQA